MLREFAEGALFQLSTIVCVTFAFMKFPSN